PSGWSSGCSGRRTTRQPSSPHCGPMKRWPSRCARPPSEPSCAGRPSNSAPCRLASNVRHFFFFFFLLRRETRGREKALTLVDNHGPGPPQRGAHHVPPAHPVRRARRASYMASCNRGVTKWTSPKTDDQPTDRPNRASERPERGCLRPGLASPDGG